MKFQVRQRIEADEATFWRVFFDESYNESLFSESLGFRLVPTLLDRAADGSVHRKLEVEPRLEMPAVIRKLVGGVVSYKEEGRFEPKARRWSWTITPSALPERVKIAGVDWVDPVGEGAIERVLDCELSVRILGLGTLIETFIVRSVRDHHQKAADFMNAYLREGRHAAAGMQAR